MSEIEKAKETSKKAPCSQCGGLRNCEIIVKHNERGGDEHYDWLTEWYLLQCRGCDHVFVETVSSNSEEYYQGYGPDGETITEYLEAKKYWPALSKRKKPDWMSEAGIDADGTEPLNKPLAEVYGALNNDLNMLAAIGIRTCFDVAAELLGIETEQSFNAKLDDLVTGGHIGKVDKAHLEVLVDAGGASAHRGWQPQTEELNTLMDVLEHFLHDAFVNRTRKAKRDADIVKIKARVPPRKARASAKKAKA